MVYMLIEDDLDVADTLELDPGGECERIRWSAIPSVEILAVIHRRIDESTEAAKSRVASIHKQKAKVSQAFSPSASFSHVRYICSEELNEHYFNNAKLARQDQNWLLLPLVFISSSLFDDWRPTAPLSGMDDTSPTVRVQRPEHFFFLTSHYSPHAAMSPAPPAVTSSGGIWRLRFTL